MRGYPPCTDVCLPKQNNGWLCLLSVFAAVSFQALRRACSLPPHRMRIDEAALTSIHRELCLGRIHQLQTVALTHPISSHGQFARHVSFPAIRAEWDAWHSMKVKRRDLVALQSTSHRLGIRFIEERVWSMAGHSG